LKKFDDSNLNIDTYYGSRSLKTEADDTKPVIIGTVYNDFQRTHSGLSDHERIIPPKCGLKLRENMFTISNFQKTY
jgi:hypothetical protein